MAGYYTEIAIEDAIKNLASSAPSVARVLPLLYGGDEVRGLSALHIGPKPPPSGRPTIMIIGGIHGDEWGSSEIALAFATDLLKAHRPPSSGLAYGRTTAFSKQEIQDLLAQRDFVVFPLVNPDGRQHSHTIGPRTWRKNRRRFEDNGVLRGIGVDLNRNFDFAWDLGIYAELPCASVEPSHPNYYQGPWPASEWETRNVAHLFDQVASVRWFVDLHCTGPSMRYVWNIDQSQSADTLKRADNIPPGQSPVGKKNDSYGEYLDAQDLLQMDALATRFAADVKNVRGKVYKTGPSYLATPFPGTSHDWAYARRKALAFVCEWGFGDHQPDWPEMGSIIEEVTAGLVGFSLQTLQAPQP